MANSITAATLLEKAKAIRDRVAEIDRQAAGDKGFRQLVLEYFNIKHEVPDPHDCAGLSCDQENN